VERSEEISRGLIVTRGDAAVLFGFTEEILDQVAGVLGHRASLSAIRTRHWHGAKRRRPRLAGWRICRLWLRDVSEGMSLLRSGTAAFRGTGAELFAPYPISLLAGACQIAGEIEESLTLFDEALQTVERTGERWFVAELNRQRANCCCSWGIPRLPRSSFARP
jgi:predicted ATPase